MQRLEVSGAVRPIYGSLGVKRLIGRYYSTCSPLNPLNAELNPICHLLALLGVHHILHVSRIKVKLKFRRNKIPQHSSEFIINIGSSVNVFIQDMNNYVFPQFELPFKVLKTSLHAET